jgi:hypothetical protein
MTNYKPKDAPKDKPKGAGKATSGGSIEEDNRREEAVPAPPAPPRSILAGILQEARRPSITTRPPPRVRAQHPVTRNMTNEEANGHSSVSLCPGNHQRLACHWSLHDPNNTDRSWRVNLVDYIDDEETRKQHRKCSERSPAKFREMLAERREMLTDRVFDDLKDRFDEVRRRGATGITRPVFRRIQEELTPLVNRVLNSLSSTGRSPDTAPASKSTAPPSSARDAQEEKKKQEQQKEAWDKKIKRLEEEQAKVNADRAKREEARRIADEAKREEEARRTADEAALQNSAAESTRSLSYSLTPAAGTSVKTPKKTVQDSKKSETKSAGGGTTTRAQAARPIVESDTSSDYSDSVKPPQPSKEDIAAAKLMEETPATPTKKTPAKSTEKAPVKPTEKAAAKSTEKTPAKPTEEAPAKPTTSAEPTTSAKSTETAPAKPDPKASGTRKKMSLAELAAKRKAAKDAAEASTATAEASTATATADAGAEATVETTAEIEEAHGGSHKKIEVKETITTTQSSPGVGEIIEKHETTHVISTETQAHGTPPPPSTEHKSKDNTDVEAPSSQPPSPDSPGKRKRSAAEEEPLPDSDTRSRRSDAPSPREDVPSPRKKSKTVTPPGSPSPPPGPPPTSPANWTSKKRKAGEEGEVTITSPGGTKRARSDDGKDGKASTPSAPAEEQSVDAEAEPPADDVIEALFHSDSEENGSPGLPVLTAGEEASSSPAQAREDPAGTEE